MIDVRTGELRDMRFVAALAHKENMLKDRKLVWELYINDADKGFCRGHTFMIPLHDHLAPSKRSYGDAPPIIDNRFDEMKMKILRDNRVPVGNFELRGR